MLSPFKKGTSEAEGLNIKHMPTKHFNKSEIKHLRRKLRKKMTAAEVALWLMIKNKQIEGIRFLRQYSVDKYILDFYCPQHKLAIELDGESHNDIHAIEYDKKRTEHIYSMGIRVLRFENFEIFDYPERTIDEIIRYINDKDLIPPKSVF